jgi:hypothetical protein
MFAILTSVYRALIDINNMSAVTVNFKVIGLCKIQFCVWRFVHHLLRHFVTF